MSEHKHYPMLLNSLSLPQRLVYCMFHPYLINSLFFALITTWTFHSFHTENSIIYQRSTASTSTITSGLGVYNHKLSKNITLNLASVDTLAQQYMTSKSNSTVSYINEVIENYWYRDLQLQLVTWNDTLTNNIADNLQYFKNLQVYNEVIHDQLLSNANVINATLQKLAKTGLLLETSDNNNYNEQLTNNFTLNYWFLDSLFGNVSGSIDSLDTISQMVALPNVLVPTLKSVQYNNSESLATSLDIFKGKLNNISRLYANDSLVTNLKKRSLAEDDTAKSSSDRKTVRIYTAVFIVVYIILVPILMVFEWIKFRWEKVLFNEQYSSMISELEDYKINSLQGSRKCILQLQNSMNNIIVHMFSNSLFKSFNVSLKRWKKTTAFNQWIYTNGLQLWVLFFNVVIYWEIIANISSTGTTSSNSTNGKSIGMSQEPFNMYTNSSTAEVVTNTTTKIDTSYKKNLIDDVNYACMEFQTSADFLIYNMINNQLWSENTGILSKLINSTNIQMKSLIHSLTSETSSLDIADWTYQNVTVPISLPNLSENNLTMSILTNAFEVTILDHLDIEMNTSTQKSSEKQLSTSTVSSSSQLHQIRKWSLIITTILIIFHHIMGYILFNRI